MVRGGPVGSLWRLPPEQLLLPAPSSFLLPPQVHLSTSLLLPAPSSFLLPPQAHLPTPLLQPAPSIFLLPPQANLPTPLLQPAPSRFLLPPQANLPTPLLQSAPSRFLLPPQRICPHRSFSQLRAASYPSRTALKQVLPTSLLPDFHCRILGARRGRSFYHGSRGGTCPWADRLLPTFFDGASCWAFTAIATVEGINVIAGGNLVSLSEQELVDCDDLGTHCQPGLISKGYDYIIRNGGIDTDTNYPYTDRQGVCKADKNQEVTIDGYAYAPFNNERALRMRVATQPVGALLDAGGPGFQFYVGGIHKKACTTDVNHAVTIVGYGSEAGEDYWIIKNSYGQNWGEGGYMKLPRNDADRRGKCGIGMWPIYPTKRQNPKSS